MSYQILDDEGNVINTINADQEFVEQNYPNRWAYVPDPPRIEPKPIKTDEEKLADAISAAVAKLIADGVLKQA
jgi:hypothetical protein